MEEMALKRLLGTLALTAFLLTMLLAAGLRGAVLAVVAGVRGGGQHLVAVIASSRTRTRTPRRFESWPVRRLPGSWPALSARRARLTRRRAEQGLAQKIPAKEAVQELPARAKRQLEAPRRRSGEDSRGWKLNNLSAASGIRAASTPP